MTTGKHASPSDCPCCHECLAPGIDTDRALVVAFLAGVAARDQTIPMAETLCEHHAALCADALRHAMANARARARGPTS